jgi:hypothetical protein
MSSFCVLRTCKGGEDMTYQVSVLAPLAMMVNSVCFSLLLLDTEKMVLPSIEYNKSV